MIAGVIYQLTVLVLCYTYIKRSTNFYDMATMNMKISTLYLEAGDRKTSDKFFELAKADEVTAIKAYETFHMLNGISLIQIIDK